MAGGTFPNQSTRGWLRAEAIEQAAETLEGTVVLEGWANRVGRQALREVFEAYRNMLGDAELCIRAQGFTGYSPQSILPRVQGEVPMVTDKGHQRLL